MNGATQKTHAQTYALRFRRVLDFIDAYLDESLTAERLCQIAHFSKFHFLEHRGNPALLNASVQRFIAWRKESGLSPVNVSHTYGSA